MKMPLEELIDSHFEEIKGIWSSYDYSDYEPISQSLTIYTDPSKDEDGYVDMIISMGGLKEDLLKWFLSPPRN